MKRTSVSLVICSLLAVAGLSGCGLDDHHGRDFDREGNRQGHVCDATGAPLDATATGADGGSSLDAASAPDGTSGTADAGLANDSTSTGDAVGSPGDVSATACGRASECSTTQDCVNGFCLTRCTASCQCPGGESCVTGYCAIVPLDPTKPCTVDCECPSGAKCLGGFCK